MILIRRLGLPLAGSRYGAAAVAAVVFLVLAVAGVHLVFSMDLNGPAGGAARAQGGHGHGAEHSRGSEEAVAPSLHALGISRT